MQILGISGSLRRGSYNTALLRAAERALPPGARFALFGALQAIPPFDEDGDPPPAPVHTLRQAIVCADAVVISTPEYNSSIPGQLKNALDWASRPFPANAFRDKPVAVIGASTGLFGAVWAQAELRKVLRSVGARVVDRELRIATAHEAFDTDGELLDPDSCSALGQIVRELVEAGRAGRSEVAA